MRNDSSSKFVAEVARLPPLLLENANSGEFGYRKYGEPWNY
jgi:hypothetical protein